MIRHIVAWKLAATDPDQKAADAAEIVRVLSALRDTVPSVKALNVGANMAYFEKNWDVVLVADYETLADLDAYQTHPEHVAAAPVVAARVSDRASVDIEI
ncbi:Dabb family protein [Herbiconiux liukaitaii]|uniref:Dabb family protein n=1 Tax=Herbiconiux liukaitaii TaxID=3342799 RepID=UPI0035BA4589